MLNKRLIILLLTISFLTAGPIFTRGNSFAQERVEPKTLDRRAEILQAYLTKYNSPLQYQAQNFIEAADTYNLDWRLLAAISGVESTFGKFMPGGYNAWGWGVYGNQALYFTSFREGIFTVSQGLRENYLNRGLTNPYSMNKAYAASPFWGSKVSYFLTDMDKFQNQYFDQEIETLQVFPKTAGTSAWLAQRLP